MYPLTFLDENGTRYITENSRGYIMKYRRGSRRYMSHLMWASATCKLDEVTYNYLYALGIENLFRRY